MFIRTVDVCRYSVKQGIVDYDFSTAQQRHKFKAGRHGLDIRYRVLFKHERNTFYRSAVERIYRDFAYIYLSAKQIAELLFGRVADHALYRIERQYHVNCCR